MKIGVDARILSRPITGIGRYTLEMCRALFEIKNVSLYLYSPASLNSEALVGLEAGNIRMAGFNNSIVKQIWSESYLPLWAKKDEIDVFWGPSHRLPRRLPKTMARVVTIHDLVWKYAGDTMRTLSRWLERYQMPAAIQCADKIVPVSKATAEALQKEFPTSSAKLVVVSPGAMPIERNTVPFVSLVQLGIERPFFLFVGTLEPRKNLLRLLRAYAHLPESLKNQIMFVIVGGKGWGKMNITDTVANLNLKNYVRILGYVDEPTLATLYAKAEFLAMPSLYEGFGLPVIEAMAYGTPVLTSANSSMPEVAGNAGLLVDPLDVDSIQGGLTRLIVDREFRKKLASETKANVARFNWNASAEKLVHVFEDAMTTRRGRTS